ncbi:transposase [Thermodesulfobacteriota bacterium]
MKKRKQFTREFKLEALRLLEEGKKPAADLARELGIRRNLLYKWKDIGLVGVSQRLHR